MRKILYLSFLLTSCSHGVKNQAAIHKASDTVFLLREKTKDYYHAIYIDPNPQSKEYKWITDFTFDKYEAESYKETYQQEKQKHPAPFKKYDLAGISKEWVPLYSYKGKYYLYSPSDVGDEGKCMITDSTLVWWIGDEGPGVKSFKSAHKIDNYTYFIKTSAFYIDSKNIMLTIHIIDDKNKIAVWEDAGQPKDRRYGLYVPKENAKNFPIIVNYCLENRVMEFGFDTIDYKKLLAHKP